MAGAHVHSMTPRIVASTTRRSVLYRAVQAHSSVSARRSASSDSSTVGGAETKRIVGMWWRGSGRWLDAYTGDYIAPAFVLGWADMPKGWA